MRCFDHSNRRVLLIIMHVMLTFKYLLLSSHICQPLYSPCQSSPLCFTFPMLMSYKESFPQKRFFDVCILFYMLEICPLD